MDTLIERLSSYNILNNMLPGAVFCYLLNLFMNINLVENEFIEKLFIYYFWGMIVSRVGSIIIEPISKKIKLVEFAQYKEFIKASSKDAKIDVLSETNNTYRTMLSVCMLLLLTKVYLFLKTKFLWLANYQDVIVIVILVILFASAYRKQTEYVKKRIEHVNNYE